MKVDPNSRTGAAGGKRAGKTAGAGGQFAQHLEKVSQTDAGEAASGVSGVRASDPLIAVQQVDDGPEGRARQHGEELLKRLEELRDSLLAGAVSTDRLKDLSRMVAERRENVADPRLREILDEIDLRARVELAKLGFDS